MGSWRWLVGLASGAAFVFGAGIAWLWLAQREMTAPIGYRNEMPTHQKDICLSPSQTAGIQAAGISHSAPTSSATITQPSPAPASSSVPTVAVPVVEPRPAKQPRSPITKESASLPKKQQAPTPPQVARAQQRRGAATAPLPAGNKPPSGKPATEALLANRVRSWQRSGQWVVLVSRSEGTQVQRLEQTRQQLSPLVPHGLQLVILSLPKHQSRLLVLGPFPSEEAAGKALWALSTPFLLKQPQVMPARALF